MISINPDIHFKSIYNFPIIFLVHLIF